MSNIITDISNANFDRISIPLLFHSSVQTFSTQTGSGDFFLQLLSVWHIFISFYCISNSFHDLYSVENGKNSFSISTIEQNNVNFEFKMAAVKKFKVCCFGLQFFRRNLSCFHWHDTHFLDVTASMFLFLRCSSANG